VPAMARHLPSSRCRGRQAQAPEAQALPHRVLENGSAKVCHGSGVIISLRAT
jgi:hypothetical protein